MLKRVDFTTETDPWRKLDITRVVPTGFSWYQDDLDRVVLPDRRNDIPVDISQLQHAQRYIGRFSPTGNKLKGALLARFTENLALYLSQCTFTT